MDRIRDWMQANPDEGKELRRRNKSFVFFRETGLAEHEEPTGAQGISLTPGRSIAVGGFHAELPLTPQEKMAAVVPSGSVIVDFSLAPALNGLLEGARAAGAAPWAAPLPPPRPVVRVRLPRR